MLSLATHEPHFRVLREDVFHQEGSKTACRICGQEGHYAAQCTGEKKVKQDENDVKSPPENKPFIFADISILREYLEIELNVTFSPFPFDLERAIDDWVLMIFFVGNDFLPHLPSLEIREGAIDTLLRIWKEELPRMGGYLTNHGQIELARAEIILEGLAKREDDIFRRRREGMISRVVMISQRGYSRLFTAEERQDQNAKRRKIEANGGIVDGGMRMGETIYVPVETSGEPPIHPSLPQRPAFEVAPVNNHTSRLSMPPSHIPLQEGIKLASNHDVVANRRAIRMANLNAAEMLKAELAGRASVQNTATAASTALPPVADEKIVVPEVPATASDVPVEPSPLPLPSLKSSTSYEDYASMDVLPGLGGSHTTEPVGTLLNVRSNETPSVPPSSEVPPITQSLSEDAHLPPNLASIDADEAGEGSEVMDTESSVNGGNDVENSQQFDESRGTKRKVDDVEEEDNSMIEDDGPLDASDAPVAARKVNPDGTVEQADTVKCVSFMLSIFPLKCLVLGYGNQGTGIVITSKSSKSN